MADGTKEATANTDAPVLQRYSKSAPKTNHLITGDVLSHGTLAASKTVDDGKDSEATVTTLTSGGADTTGAPYSAPGNLEVPGAPDFRSETTPEAKLLSKFKHVYAGKGGWLGISTSASGESAEGAVEGTSGVVRTRVFLPPKHHTLSTSVSVLHKRGTMPRTQYERYKKEIMHKLARTLQEHQAGNDRSSKDHEGTSPEPMMCSLDIERDGGLLPPGPVPIPASWRLPVGWAGRNRGLLGGTRERTRRQREHHSGRFQSSVTAATVGRSSGHSGATTRASGNTASTKRERPGFRRSWMENKLSGGAHARPKGEKEDVTTGEVDGNRSAHHDSPPSFKFRIGHLLSPRDPNTTTDGESSLAPPSSKAKTEVPRPLQATSENGPDTSRTGVTSQTFPFDNSRRRATYPAGAATGKQQQPHRKSSNTSQNGAGPVPTSSRGGMNMFSRMSIEAQAALKELGAAPVEEHVHAKGELLNDDGNNAASGTNNTGAPVASQIAQPPRRNRPMANTRNTGRDKENRTTIVSLNHPVQRYKGKRPVKVMPEQMDTRDQPISNAVERLQRDINGDADIGVQNSDMQVSNKMERYNNRTEGAQKQCSCKVRAGIVLKHSPNTEPSITLRVIPPSYQEDTNGNTDCDYHTLEGDQVKVTLSQASRTRLPNIQESPTGSVVMGDNTVNTTSTPPFVGTHRQIPGVGHYKVTPSVAKPLLIKNWSREKTFEITPVGYDSRFEDLAVKEDIDETPDEIKQKAIVKCNDWLKKYH